MQGYKQLQGAKKQQCLLELLGAACITKHVYFSRSIKKFSFQTIRIRTFVLNFNSLKEAKNTFMVFRHLKLFKIKYLSSCLFKLIKFSIFFSAACQTVPDQPATNQIFSGVFKIFRAVAKKRAALKLLNINVPRCTTPDSVKTVYIRMNKFKIKASSLGWEKIGLKCAVCQTRSPQNLYKRVYMKLY